jgi:uncharacterized membrane protein YdbT with pleckstrin-like domain
MSIARQLLESHTFGVSPGSFAAASSSIAWPFLLAGLFWCFGIHPFLLIPLNIIAVPAGWRKVASWTLLGLPQAITITRQGFERRISMQPAPRAREI